MKSHFHFIDDDIRKKNLDITFNHILELTTLLDSPKYIKDLLLISSFRKSIIINTASIIEALLLEKLYKKYGNEISLKETWKYLEIKILYKETESVQVVGCTRKKTEKKKKLEKLNFADVNKECQNLGLFEKTLFKKIDKVRQLRNRLHIWGLKDVDREYTKKDLEFVFSVAAEVKKLFK